MKPMRNSITWFVAAMLLTQLFRCTGNQPDNVAGGLETTNGTTISVVDGTITGITAAHALIIVCDTAYVPVETGPLLFIDTVTSDTKGNFAVPELPQGTYTVITQHTGLSVGCLISPVKVDSAGTTATKDSSVFMPLAEIPVQTRTESAVAPKSIVFIPGTPFQTLTGETGTGLLTGIPSGTYRVQAYLKKQKDLEPQFYVSTVDNVHASDSTDMLNILLTPQ